MICIPNGCIFWMSDHRDAGSSPVSSRWSSRPEAAEFGSGETQRAEGVWSEFTFLHQIHSVALSPGWWLEITSIQITVPSQDLREKETLLSTGVQNSAETEQLLATVESLTAERDQLKVDLNENIEMVGDLSTCSPRYLSDSLLFSIYNSLHFIT